MGDRGTAETHSQPHSHAPAHTNFHRAFPPSPNHVVERLVRLKDSDPELFSEAWNRLPNETRENILSYLKRYPNLLEKEYPLLLLHRAGKLSGDEVEEFEDQGSMGEASAGPARTVERTDIVPARQPAPRIPRANKYPHRAATPRAPGRSPAFPLSKPPSKLVKSNGKRRSPLAREKADALYLEELRKISKQNSMQIDLLQRLLKQYEIGD